MTFLLDTDWLIDYLSGDAAAQTLITTLLSDAITLNMVTYVEIYEGIERSPTPRTDERAFRAFLSGVEVLPFNRTVARQAARIRAQLRPQYPSIVRRRALDVLIAATAIVYDLTLVSRNRDDYRVIPGLKLY
jgi:predicted nucleic acid-binding protein